MYELINFVNIIEKSYSYLIIYCYDSPNSRLCDHRCWKSCCTIYIYIIEMSNYLTIFDVTHFFYPLQLVTQLFFFLFFCDFKFKRLYFQFRRLRIFIFYENFINMLYHESNVEDVFHLKLKTCIIKIVILSINFFLIWFIFSRAYVT